METRFRGLRPTRALGTDTAASVDASGGGSGQRAKEQHRSRAGKQNGEARRPPKRPEDWRWDCTLRARASNWLLVTGPRRRPSTPNARREREVRRLPQPPAPRPPNTLLPQNRQNTPVRHSQLISFITSVEGFTNGSTLYELHDNHLKMSFPFPWKCVSL